jgi:hypothetical protein
LVKKRKGGPSRSSTTKVSLKNEDDLAPIVGKKRKKFGGRRGKE